ncbi:MAG: ribbon-helix-helix domain-containing protein [Candidatus Heimdallarchaeota archaeon]
MPSNKGKKRIGTILTQVRMPGELVKSIDFLVEKGIFQSRSDFLFEATRMLLARYSKGSPVREAVALAGKTPLKPEKKLLNEKQRKAILDHFKGLTALEVCEWSKNRL